jgi:acyl dehydratase
MPQHATIQVGDTLEPFERSPGLDHWNRFAAVNDEFVSIHMDDDAGRAAGYPTAFGMGNLQWSYLHSLLRAWIGESGRILSVSCQFRAPNIKGQTVSAHGQVTAVHEVDGETLVELEVWTQDQEGTKMAPGRAQVAIRR